MMFKVDRVRHDARTIRRRRRSSGQHSAAALWRDAPVSCSVLALTAGITTVGICVASGVPALLFPWIVIITAMKGFPPAGQIANVAAGFTLLAAGWWPLERRGRRVGQILGVRRSATDLGRPRPNRSNMDRGLSRRGLVALGVVLAASIGVVAANVATESSTRTTPVIVQAAIRTQQNGDTALAFETLAPAASGKFERSKFDIYYFCSGWAGDLQDWSLASTLSVYLMKAAAAVENPTALVTGVYQYVNYRQAFPSRSVASAVTAAAVGSRWRQAVRLLVGLPETKDRALSEAVVVRLARGLRPRLQTNLVAALELMEHYIELGRLRPQGG